MVRFTIKEKRQNLIDSAYVRLKAMGAYETEYVSPDGIAELYIATKFSPLKILADHDDFYRTSKTITLFCKFYDPAALKAFGLDGNHFSGKWNHHGLDEVGLELILRKIEKLLV
jgi:hypothetical protein